MKLHKTGDRSKAICAHCGQVRTTTFRERDVPLSSGQGTVRDVLVAVCDACDRVVAIPQQSVPRIQEAVYARRHPVEARVPRHLLDALGLACHELGFGVEHGPVLFRYYLQRASSTARLRARLAVLAASEDAAGPANARFSAKLSDYMHGLLQGLEHDGRLTKAEVVKGLIVQIKKDVLDDKRKGVRRELQGVMRLAA